MDRIVALRPGERLEFADVGVSICRNEGIGEARQRESRRKRRPVILCLVAHPHLTVTVEDWYSAKCKSFVRYSGERDGNFLSTYTHEYITELMYLWVCDICFKGRSFRDAFNTTCQNACAISTVHRHGLVCNVLTQCKE